MSVTTNNGAVVERHEATPPLSLVALLVGDPQAPELWTLKQLATAPCTLHVVRAQKATSVPQRKRLRRLLREHGMLGVASRLFGTKLIGDREDRKRSEQLDQLLDGEHLREWWSGSGIVPVDVPHLNHGDARSTIAALQPDIMVRVSGGILKRETFALARLATLNIHHGCAPQIRGMWSIPWGIVEGRCDWIGATVHVIDDGIDTGRILWRGGPQLAPGDTGDKLFFRAHLEAVAALVRVINSYAEGAVPSAWPSDDVGPSVYRSAPGLWAWWQYLRLSRGKRARVILERALKC